MLSASTGLAVPEKILNRSSFTAGVLLHVRVFAASLVSASGRDAQTKTFQAKSDPAMLQPLTVDGLLWLETLKVDSPAHTPGFTRRCASYERTCRARESRKRRSGRAETQQRLGAPSLGSGKFQTPPNRYPPARLLSLLFGARPA